MAYMYYQYPYLGNRYYPYRVPMPIPTPVPYPVAKEDPMIELIKLGRPSGDEQLWSILREIITGNESIKTFPYAEEIFNLFKKKEHNSTIVLDMLLQILNNPETKEDAKNAARKVLLESNVNDFGKRSKRSKRSRKARKARKARKTRKSSKSAKLTRSKKTKNIKS